MNIVVLSGPTIAEDVVSGSPICAALAGADLQTLRFVAKALAWPSFELVVSADLVRTEWGGVLKNIYAIKMGMLSKSNKTSFSNEASFFSKACHEMERFMEKMGALEPLGEKYFWLRGPYCNRSIACQSSPSFWLSYCAGVPT